MSVTIPALCSVAILSLAFIALAALHYKTILDYEFIISELEVELSEFRFTDFDPSEHGHLNPAHALEGT